MARGAPVRPHIFTPYEFCPFKTCIAVMASGIGLPPRMRTPSMSNAKAYLSVVEVSGGVVCVDSGDENSSSWCLANSMAAAVSCASLGTSRCFGGTTTVGRRNWRISFVASWTLRLRSLSPCREGTIFSPEDILLEQ